MIGRAWLYSNGEQDFQDVTADTPHVGPWDDSLEAKRQLARHGLRPFVENLMRDQIRLIEKMAPEASGGGRIIAATVTRYAVNCEHWGLLARIRPRPAEASA